MRCQRGVENGRVLVVDSSVDYIEHIDRRHPGRALFVTDPAERQRGALAPPEAASEVLVSMEEPRTVLEAVRSRLAEQSWSASGVACFDCESMPLAAFLAQELGLPYPSGHSVLACRSKFLSKEIWKRARLNCPAARQVESAREADAFREKQGGTVVLKPLTGSGSELVFFCHDRKECEDALATLRRRLDAMPTARMYAALAEDGCEIDPRRFFLAEEWCSGEEFSCDFIVENARLRVVRIARKWLKPDPAPGTALAYQVPAELPASLDRSAFLETLRRAAAALKMERAVCMLDFLVAGDRIILLEMAPRPGGDCLPHLLHASCGLDMLGLALDVAEGRPFHVPPAHRWEALVGLRLFAARSGTVATIDAGALCGDPRVRSVRLEHGPGHQVVLPPDDYHARVLGHAVFRPDDRGPIALQCQELLGKLLVTYREEAGA